MEPTAVRPRAFSSTGAARTPRPAPAADPRKAALLSAVVRVRRALAVHPGWLADREVADEELARLQAVAGAGTVEVTALRHGLLLVVGALGSVSALTEPLRELRGAVALFGEPPERR
ncbi:DUF5955 family protein [Streptomyces chumphonensis]|uniref:DUF5955 family protein n=1 Tax=Streptomyces chumphonensis TaxID=1214925 RepID=UPI003D72FCD5